MSNNTYNVTLIYKENIVIKVEGATEYLLLHDEYKNDSYLPEVSMYSLPIEKSNLRKALITHNTEENTFNVVNLLVFKLVNGEQVVTTKDLLSISVTKN